MRVVLDTNVVLDLVVFDDPGVEALRAAIEARLVTLLSNAECRAELHRVLAYPRFGLDTPSQDMALRWFDARAEVFEAPPAHPPPPRCSDPDDQKLVKIDIPFDPTTLAAQPPAAVTETNVGGPSAPLTSLMDVCT